MISATTTTSNNNNDECVDVDSFVQMHHDIDDLLEDSSNANESRHIQ